MKERPILFSTEMVKAILEGRKTQTRRVIKLANCWFDDKGSLKDTPYYKGEELVKTIKCPYGQVGDRLWVRETWSPWADKTTQFYAGGEDELCLYRADYREDRGGNLPADIGGDYHWHPSIHLPRKFSRIALEITGIRVERVQDISEADAKVEGAPYYGPNDEHGDERSYLEGFRHLWDSINGEKHPWSSNCWVWVIEFKRIEGIK